MSNEWKAVQDTLNSIRITGRHGEVVAEIMNDEAGDVTDEMKATADLIVTVVNACVLINPGNPMATAESIKDMHAALKGMLATFGDTYKIHSNPKSRDILLKPVTKARQALDKAGGRKDETQR